MDPFSLALLKGIWKDNGVDVTFISVGGYVVEKRLFILSFCLHLGGQGLGHNYVTFILNRAIITLSEDISSPSTTNSLDTILNGSQRYVVTWTGGNLSTWEQLHMIVSMLLQMEHGANDDEAGKLYLNKLNDSY